MDNLTVYIDGASKGNPGRASIGIVICPDGRTPMKKTGRSIGEATNNVAEYIALITALIDCAGYKPKQLQVKSDSLLLIKQMEGQYKVKDPWLQKLHFIASRLVSGYNSVVFTHIPREQNTEADKVANEHIKDGLF